MAAELKNNTHYHHRPVHASTSKKRKGIMQVSSKRIRLRFRRGESSRRKLGLGFGVTPSKALDYPGPND